MLKRISIFGLLICLSFPLSSCSDDDSISKKDMTKGLLTVAGAGGGALLGQYVAGPQNQMLGTVLGAASGGALGYFVGGNLNN
ncbi:MAG: glycine zipper 2TM domain-containing protein [Oligoflexia bacterium]|nr:glycine zipper 2TM domain-containing protein [Oligoflexia bacterium]